MIEYANFIGQIHWFEHTLLYIYNIQKRLEHKFKQLTRFSPYIKQLMYINADAFCLC